MKIQTSLLVVCAFCYAVIPSVSPADDSYNYWGAALANGEAITNYDCIVKTETVFIPIDKEFEGENAGYSEELTERCIFDPKEEICFRFLKRRIVAADPKKPPPAKLKLPFERFQRWIYVDGKPLVTNGKKSYSNIIHFMAGERIPRMDMASVNGHPYLLGNETKGEHIARQLGKKPQGWRSTIQPNGDVLCSYDVGEYLIDSFLFDTKRLVVKRYTRQQQEGANVYKTAGLGVERDYHYELVEGIYRLVQMDFEEAPMLHERYHKIGTASVKWMQFNVPKVRHPSEEEILSNRKNRGYFLSEKAFDVGTAE